MDCEFSIRENRGKRMPNSNAVPKKKPKIKEAEGSSGFGVPVSYRDKLVKEILGAFAQTFNLNARKEDHSTPNEEMGELSEGLLAVRLSSDTRKLIRSKWTHTLIVRVFGRSMGYHYLHFKVISLWKPAGHLDCVDLGNELFLMRFGLVEDFDKLWFIGGHYLTIHGNQILSLP